MSKKPKNIVICLDGTGNQIEENLSNVLKLYRSLRKNDEQIVFYDQGVGTLEKVGGWGRFRQKLRLVLGLAFGWGLDANVLQAYEFIVQNYREYKTKSVTERDRIYIFGYSRGAHTARVLAGLIYEIGILKPEQIHLSEAALMAYKQSAHSILETDKDEDDFEGEGMNFRRIAQPYTAAIAFLGLFDTVSAVFVPNPKGIWPPLTREKLPHTAINPAVKSCRHAVSIDEKRRMFRLDRWPLDQAFKPNIHSQGEMEKQDAKEVWFAGYHGDVGGGHKRKDSGASQIPLIWMLEQAKAQGLDVFDRMADYVTGQKPYTSTTEYLYPKPDPTAPLHDSMRWIWPPFEYVPKHKSLKEWPDRKVFLSYYLPLSEPRLIAEDADIHPSVLERMKQTDYQPVNLPPGKTPDG